MNYAFRDLPDSVKNRVTGMLGDVHPVLKRAIPTVPEYTSQDQLQNRGRTPSPTTYRRRPPESAEDEVIRQALHYAYNTYSTRYIPHRHLTEQEFMSRRTHFSYAVQHIEGSFYRELNRLDPDLADRLLDLDRDERRELFRRFIYNRDRPFRLDYPPTSDEDEGNEIEDADDRDESDTD